MNNITSTFILIHGMGGTKDDHWYPWLGRELEPFGHKVILKTFPKNLKADIKETMTFLEYIIKGFNGNFNFITHSSGCAPAFKIAEKYKLKNIYIVSGLYEDLGYEEEIESRLYEGGFDYTKIKNNTEKIIQIDSDNDPYIPKEHFIVMSELLDSKRIILEGRRHFGDPEDSPKKFPELLEVIKSDYNDK